MDQNIICKFSNHNCVKLSNSTLAQNRTFLVAVFGYFLSANLMNNDYPVNFDFGFSQELTRSSDSVLSPDLQNVLSADLIYAGITPRQSSEPFPINFGPPIMRPAAMPQNDIPFSALPGSSPMHGNMMPSSYFNEFGPQYLHNSAQFNNTTGMPHTNGAGVGSLYSTNAMPIYTANNSHMNQSMVSSFAPPWNQQYCHNLTVAIAQYAHESPSNILPSVNASNASMSAIPSCSIPASTLGTQSQQLNIEIPEVPVNVNIAMQRTNTDLSLPEPINNRTDEAQSELSQTIRNVMNDHGSAEARQENELRFPDVSADDVHELVEKARCLNTIKATAWAVKTFKSFLDQRRISNEEIIAQPEHMRIQAVIKYMMLFVVGAKTKKGTNYTLQSLACLIAGMQRFFRENGHPGVDFLTVGPMNELRKVINAKMKDLGRLGYGTVSNQVHPLTEEHIAIFWEKGVLGDKDALTMLRTVYFYISYWFLVRNGASHLDLDMSQFIFSSDTNHNIISFYPRADKNHQFSLDQIRRKQNVITHYSPKDANPCAVLILEQYFDIIGHAVGRVYFQPSYPLAPGKLEFNAHLVVGANKLSGIVKEMCTEAGICGYFTNRSIRHGSISTMFLNGISDKVIRGRTGHTSNALETYKRPSDDARREVSTFLNPPQKKGKMIPDTTNCTKVDSKMDNKMDEQASCSKTLPECGLSATAGITSMATSSKNDGTQSVENAQLKTTTEMLSKIFDGITYNNCNVNFYINTEGKK